MPSIISTDALAADREDEGQLESEIGSEPEVRRSILPVGAHGLRLDRALVTMVPEFSRNYLQQLMALGAVTLNGSVAAKPSLKAKAGDHISIEMRATHESRSFVPEEIPLEIVFQDEHLLVIDKPAGLVVHPAPGNWSGTLLNALLARHEEAGLLPRAGIVHRLDKDTSGLMVVARTRTTMDQLTKMIALREVSREYIALAHVAWQGKKTVEVREAIGRDPRNRLRMAVVDQEKSFGKSASTTISLVKNATDQHNFCLVRCILGTGRTHQIRVHMAFLKHPLVGDQTYGGAPAGGLSRQALHACALAFHHPATGKPMVFYSLPPPDFQSAQEALGLIYN